MKSNRLAFPLLTAALVVGFSSQLAAQEAQPADNAPAPAAYPYPDAPPPVPANQADCPFGACEQVSPILSKLPYVSRLFKNVGVGRTASGVGAGRPVVRAKAETLPPPAHREATAWTECASGSCASESIGVDFEVVRDGGLIKVIQVATPSGGLACTGTQQPVVSSNSATTECACGTACACCPKVIKVTGIANPALPALRWFTFQAPSVKLPTLSSNPCLATDSITACTGASGTVCTAGVCTAPVCTTAACSAGGGAVCTGTAAGTKTVCAEGACSAAGCADVACKTTCSAPQAPTAYHGTHHLTVTGFAPHAIGQPPHQPGCPFKGIHEQLVEALTENAYLKGKAEARDQFADAFTEVSVENAKLVAQNELFSEFLELKEEMATEKQEVMESVVEMQHEFLQQLTEVQTENASLRVQLELAGERQKLVGEFVQAQLELSKKTAELQTRAAQVEQQLHAIEQVKSENVALKSRVAELLGEKPYGAYAPHATRPTTNTPGAPK